MRGIKMGDYYYYRIGSLMGRSGTISHVALEKHDEGGRLILADSYKLKIHEQKIDKEGLLELYRWLQARIEELT